jgi:hypothetical protein
MPRSYKEENWGNQVNAALQGRPRRNSAVVELTVDKSSAWVAVTRGPEHAKLKNLHC